MQTEKGDLNSMQITDVRVRKVTKEGKLKAVVSITIDNEFVVHDIKVIEGEKGLFIAMPSNSMWGAPIPYEPLPCARSAPAATGHLKMCVTATSTRQVHSNSRLTLNTASLSSVPFMVPYSSMPATSGCLRKTS